MKYAAMLIGGVVCLGFASLNAVSADETDAKTCCEPPGKATLFLAEPTTAPAAAAAKPDAKQALADLGKALAGKWKLVGKEEGAEFGQIEFKLTAGGSALMETMFPGTPHEMVNLYTVDSGDLLVTHYCAIGNQPRMTLVKAEDGVYTFDFKDCGNLAATGQYMGALTLTVADTGVTEQWTHFKDGKDSGAGVNIQLVKQ